MTYYHGGFPGLRPGDIVLPPSITGAASTASYGAGSVCRKDRVYITTIYDNAAEVGAMHPSGRGRVYVVEPIGLIKNDPDAIIMPGQKAWSFECEKARVIRVHKLSGKFIKRTQRALLREYRGAA